jgi:toxin ParE1/3/4
MPGMSPRYEHDHPALAELRVSVLSAPFNAYLIFYRPVAGGIEVVRVLHGARDIPRILAEEFGIEEGAGDDMAME